MDSKRTFIYSFLLTLAALLSWSSASLAQDTIIMPDDSGKVIERARPAEEVIMEEEQNSEYEGEEGEAHVRKAPFESENDWTRSEKNKEYYAGELKKKEFDRKRWKEITQDINYLDDVHEKKEKKPEEKKKEEPGWEGPSKVGYVGGSFFKVLMFALIIVGLALILYKLFGGTFVRNAKVDDSKIFSLEDIEERLYESDLDRMLREALQRGEYRLAVRIYYLAIIKELSIKDWIRWKKDKTNREYLNEMIASKPELYKGFSDATYMFEKVWYGDLEIRQKEYDVLSPRFRNFMDSIHRGH
jgi:hypothetical protein